MIISKDWTDYKILDAGFGEKVECWGNYTLRRPDPQILWPWQKHTKIRNTVDAHYHRSSKGGGSWEYINKIPQNWVISYKNLRFNIQPTGFKHTGLFPEQAVNWDWMIDKISKANRDINVLNLFAYTGGATVACASAGANVCHVDAAKGMVQWAKENIVLSGLQEKPVRFIVDDCMKFVQREIRRGKKYDAIIMDPPSYGRGPNGEIWKIEDELYSFIKQCLGVLSEQPLFILVNSYTTGFSPTVITNILNDLLKDKASGVVSGGEVGLPIVDTEMVLPCGIYGRWESK